MVLWTVRTDESTFESTMDRMCQIIKRIEPFTQIETLIAVEQFIVEIKKTKGVPQPNSPWNELANVRAGYWATIPGIVAETIAMWCLAPQESGKVIKNAYDKHTQVVLKIDFWVGGTSYQSKTIRILMHRVLIEKDYVEGIADFVCLTDIDDKNCFVVERTTLLAYAGKYVSRWDLEQMSTTVYNNEGKY